MNYLPHLIGPVCDDALQAHNGHIGYTCNISSDVCQYSEYHTCSMTVLDQAHGWYLIYGTLSENKQLRQFAVTQMPSSLFLERIT